MIMPSEPSADCTHLSIKHEATHAFSELVIDYLNQDNFLQEFYEHDPSLAGIEAAIKSKQLQKLDRNTLVAVLRDQYAELPSIDTVNDNIDALAAADTFTICTAHQPNLLTGHVYFFYKILHTVKLSRILSEQYADYKFVPIFYIGAEDNDLEELNHFYFNGDTYTWNTEQTGAVGSMISSGLESLWKALFSKMGPPSEHMETLKTLILEAFNGERTIAAATTYLIHNLLGQYGVVVIDANDARLKKQFVPVIQDDIFKHTAADIVAQTNRKLTEKYKSQAFVRPINLFYLKDNLRNRIERQQDKYVVVDTDISFTATALAAEISQHPERFSPNVILRGLYQETILPNLAFIGGGSEVAYWMQLKAVFDHYKVPYPVIILRQSFLVINPASRKLMDRLGLGTSAIFESTDGIIQQHAQASLDTSVYDIHVDNIHQQLCDIQTFAEKIDANLSYSAQAVHKKIVDQLAVLSTKIIRAEKRKYDTLKSQLNTLKAHLYPAGVMQERKLNFMEYYLKYGGRYFEMLLENTHAFGHPFEIIFETKD